MRSCPSRRFLRYPAQGSACAHECGWLFVDISRGGKRRWCNMRVCGNREKVARHRGQVASYEVR
ncbi:CGNR zinc finger domain-containing protein [Mesorhizobium sp. M0915]|uniref:CGNR zinc finger domain-containing protein n=1 Tax=Mesorhizobium sp. M0915 TaxID=2957027 RepID=UPI003339103C